MQNFTRVGPPSGLQGLEQLEIKSQAISCTVPGLGSFRDWSLCRPSKLSGGHICQLEAWPSGGDGGCVSGELEPAEGVCFSPICNVGSLSGEGGPGSGHIGGDYAHMAHTALVPTFLSMAIASPILLPPQQDMLMSPQQERYPLVLNGTLKPSGVDNFRWRAAATGISENAAALVVGAWRGTQTAYNSSWTKWIGWCGQR